MKIAKYIDFCIHRRSYLIWSSVILVIPGRKYLAGGRQNNRTSQLLILILIEVNQVMTGTHAEKTVMFRVVFRDGLVHTFWSSLLAFPVPARPSWLFFSGRFHIQRSSGQAAVIVKGAVPCPPGTLQYCSSCCCRTWLTIYIPTAFYRTYSSGSYARWFSSTAAVLPTCALPWFISIKYLLIVQQQYVHVFSDEIGT